jgi:hypothetical protein
LRLATLRQDIRYALRTMPGGLWNCCPVSLDASVAASVR